MIAKRMIDLIMTIPLLMITMPLIAITALLVFIFFGHPVFFFTRRPGQYGRPFTLFKIRTMTNARDIRGRFLLDDERLPAIGRILRSLSLDELPELFNVLRGDMSLVGPRPLLMRYMDRYTPEQMCRHNAKPGITGWAQVNGRNVLTWEQKFALDVWYVDHRSIWLDLKILALTIWKILKREGINQPGHVTMEEFRGYYS
jgi:sugar transferase EpsL